MTHYTDMPKLTKSQITDAMAQHKANIAASLAHRLEVARSNNNQALVEQLEREQRQLLAE
ncbi:MAG TPA: hypothetical protein V6C78_13675 [Crinalium sp.]|jgi:hypothetical protein